MDRKKINMSSQKRFFKFVNSDILLNEFLWRAENGLLAHDIQKELHINGYNLNVVSSVSNNSVNSGVFVSFYDNGIPQQRLWHISFHLEKLAHDSPHGAIHIKNNINKLYQLLYIKRIPLHCSPSDTYKIVLSRGSMIQTTSPLPRFCGMYEPTIKIVLDVLNEYFTPINNPLSLYKQLSGMTVKHPYILTVMASRPSNIAVSGLIGGKTRSNRRKSKLTRKYKHKA
jgi:hypothetical protein